MISPTKQTLHKVTKIKPALRIKAIYGLRTVLEGKIPGTAHVKAKEIMHMAGIPKRTFIANFYDVDEIVTYSYEELTAVFLEAGFTPERLPNYQTFFLLLLSRLRQHEDAICVVLNRANNKTWADIMLGIRPTITFTWSKHRSSDMVEDMYMAFASLFANILYKWKEQNFSESAVPSHVQSLKRAHYMIDH